MKFETAFDIGDKGWVFSSYYFNGHRYGINQLTIGKVSVSITDSVGIGEFAFGDNYRPQKEYLEQYMCEETGICSGSVYTLGKHIFKTKEECEAAYAAEIEEIEAAQREFAEQEKKEKLAKEAYLRSQLAEIERIKAEEQ